MGVTFQVLNAEPLLQKKKPAKNNQKCWQMRNCCLLLKWDWYFVTIEDTFVFNIYWQLEDLTPAEVDLADLMLGL